MYVSETVMWRGEEMEEKWGEREEKKKKRKEKEGQKEKWLEMVAEEVG